MSSWACWQSDQPKPYLGPKPVKPIPENVRSCNHLQPSATINNHQQPPRPDQFLVIRQPLVDILTLRRFGQDRRTDGIDLGHDVQTFAHGCTLQFQDGENLLPRHPGGGDHIIIHQEVQLERDLLQSKNHPGAHTKWAVIVDMERWNALFQFFICSSTTPFARHDGNRVCRGGSDLFIAACIEGGNLLSAVSALSAGSVWTSFQDPNAMEAKT